MKKTVITLLVLINANFLMGQDNYSTDLNGIDWVKVETKSEITIKTHDKNELLIKVKNKEPIPERAKGLRLVGSGGTDNTNLGFNVSKVGNNLMVSSIIKSQNVVIYLPKTQKIAVTNSWDGDIIIDGFTAEVEANANLNGGVVLSNISGPLTAYALNQGISVVFNSIGQSSPVVIRTTNGEIDVTLPGDTSADLALHSLNGDIYSNFDLKKPDKDGMVSISSSKVKGTINNGGVDITLDSVNGNIYLRKK